MSAIHDLFHYNGIMMLIYLLQQANTAPPAQPAFNLFGGGGVNDPAGAGMGSRSFLEMQQQMQQQVFFLVPETFKINVVSVSCLF